MEHLHFDQPISDQLTSGNKLAISVTAADILLEHSTYLKENSKYNSYFLHIPISRLYIFVDSFEQVVSKFLVWKDLRHKKHKF